ncbi:sulfotransferase domain-containing protein [Nocardioides sp. SYSU D00038]|uniref:sulfotransferase domain-containing protein n=1 Tax=Nocardioides sp. SYSU D00038 TaxID=2812554 RepID=UPI001968533B|nr:sulfotransferase domain-containing protein [Nocardioides sp. SYSU D00038]
MSEVAVRTPTATAGRRPDGLRDVARAVRDVAGRATAGQRVLPGLLISGGQRCGTTSLYKALVQQPHLHRPVWRKGVHYFDVDHHRGLDWYRSHFPLHRTLAHTTARFGAPSLAFESSPYYLFHPLAGPRIAAELPDVRVVVLVRDPVERAFSAWAHERARGFEHLSFSDALAAEEERLAGEDERLAADPSYSSHAHRHQAYRARGEYAPQLERLAGLLGRERLKVVDSHRFFTEPEPVHADLLAWLGTSAVAPTTFERHNARPRDAMPAGLRRRLEEHFAPYDEQLGAWLGRAPSWHG